MQTLWFILVAFMLTMYVVLDGFDLGAGVMHLFAAGGTMFFTFPVLYASSFSGFYLPLIMVLWFLMLRGVAVELRSHLQNAVWIAFWDGLFFLGSALLALFYGVALGNVIRGVPLNSTGTFFMPLWTDFNPYSLNPGILDWYTILIGLLALAALTAHGANYIAVKTEGELNARARRIAWLTWLVTVVLALLGTIATFSVQPAIIASFGSRPWEILFPLIALAGLAGIGYFNIKQRDLAAFFSSCAFIGGMLASAAITLYPMVLPAVNSANSLTVFNASASQYGLTVGLVWWSIGMVLAILYFVLTYRLFWGKVSLTATAGHY